MEQIERVEDLLKKLNLVKRERAQVLKDLKDKVSARQTPCSGKQESSDYREADSNRFITMTFPMFLSSTRKPFPVTKRRCSRTSWRSFGRTKTDCCRPLTSKRRL
jgi:hypothetical protein